MFYFWIYEINNLSCCSKSYKSKKIIKVDEGIKFPKMSFCSYIQLYLRNNECQCLNESPRHDVIVPNECYVSRKCYIKSLLNSL